MTLIQRYREEKRRRQQEEFDRDRARRDAEVERMIVGMVAVSGVSRDNLFNGCLPLSPAEFKFSKPEEVDPQEARLRRVEAELYRLRLYRH